MLDRRHFVIAAAAAASLPMALAKGQVTDPDESMPVEFSLNMSTIRGQNLSVPDQIEVAAKAGYDSVEPWVRDLEKFVADGGTLADVKKQIEDAGMTVASAIGFANWIVDDDAARAAALETAKKEMEMVRSIGGVRIAAPPVGAHTATSVSPPLETIARRYHALLEVGREMGVTPQLELWGFSPTLSKLGELSYVSTAAAHPDACVLPDFYHIYKGGNDFDSLGMIEASRMHCFHINDYPATPGIAEIADKDRVFPGDGVCELPKIIRGLIDHGFQGTFSLELFNPTYWQRDALEVAVEGLEKSKRVVAQAMQLPSTEV
ncbi:Inosose isomerase [Rubripirellula tenax]|uniref:Inosose isomerase n=1 Tax=Rubripirellula tenax TaxID=2528015 RepID=A0A5C6FJ62_9BACT|nr:sugar phosphate isomerase/epimerase family protein [Rubripirellula tenax]TWU60613.1 Inosose isomerase [Rubripirellula tenax]